MGKPPKHQKDNTYEKSFYDIRNCQILKLWIPGSKKFKDAIHKKNRDAKRENVR
jgi:hypothetical protein